MKIFSGGAVARPSLLLCGVLLLGLSALSTSAHRAEATDDDAAKPNVDWSRSAPFVDRNPERAQRLAGKKSVEATIAALDFLVRHQGKNGEWSSSDVTSTCEDPGELCKNRDGAHACTGPGYPNFETGVTGLCLLAFAGRGNTHLSAEKEDYRAAVDHGVRFLLSQIHPEKEGDLLSGLIGFSKAGKKFSGTDEAIYNHLIATTALAELLLGTADRAQLEAPVKRAVEQIFDHQSNSKGTRYGWKYERGGKSDSSVTAWAVQALWTARECQRAGLLDIDEKKFEEAFSGALRWYGKVTSERGYTGYLAPGDPGSRLTSLWSEGYEFNQFETPSINAAAAFTTRLAGGKKDSKLAKRRWKLLSDREPRYLPSRKKSGISGTVNFYFWFWNSHALVQKGGTPARKWKKSLEEILLEQQHIEGCSRGSWDTAGAWCPVGGRFYATAMGALCLEAPYRLKKLKK